MKDATLCAIHPKISREGFSSLSVPAERASTILFKSASDYMARAARGLDGYTYGLQGTPTARTLEAQLSALEGGLRTVILPSGMAAATTIFLTVLMPGDTVLIPDATYQPIKDFCQNYLLPRGINHRIYPASGEGLEALLDGSVKLIWMESPGSATMEILDVPHIVKLAKKHGILTGIDNSWATSLLFKPLKHGVDYSMQSLSKYVGGHSDILLGSVTVNDMALRQGLRDTTRYLGFGASPDDIALALRGIETMSVRLNHVGLVAMDIATRLQNMPGVSAVLHPGLPGAVGHAIWKRDYAGAGGLFSVALPDGAAQHLDAALVPMKIFGIGSSWGGTRSLLSPVSVKAIREFADPIHDQTLLRIYIGLEDPADIWTDIEGLFARISALMR